MKMRPAISLSISLLTFFLFYATSTGAAFAQTAVIPGATTEVAQPAAATADPTPAQQAIAAAQQQIKENPKKVQAFSDLATAYMKRSRETAQPSYLKDAADALAQGFHLDTTDFQLQRTQVALYLATHEFAKAKERATLLNHNMLDDVMTYGYLADADMALGDYTEADDSAQWMMNMRPNNLPCLLIGADLRTFFGDSRGAIEFLNRAFAETSPIEVEDLAWIANRIASVQIEAGQQEEAAQTLAHAEEIFPNYPYTLENLARVRMLQHRPADAVALLQKAAQTDAGAHLLYMLAKAQEAAGKPAEARASYAQFEQLALAPATASDDAIRDLILMYASDPARASQALPLAEHAMQLRHDVWTLDAYAWALYANGKYAQADTTIRKAIEVGIQSAQIFDHAGHIAQKLNHADDAAKFFALSIQVNPSSEFASDARQAAPGSATAPAQAAQTSAPALIVPVGQAATNSVATMSVATTPVANEIAARPDEHGTASASTSIAVFVPVPKDLLTPLPTDTDRKIHAAEISAAKNPNDATAFAVLGAAHFQRARETGDVSHYQLAEQSLNKSLDLVSTDFSADNTFETMAEVCMGEHRFADALSYAHKALSLGSGDVSPFAIVGDAYADTGEYEKSRDAYARLTPRDMTLSPRAAYARDSRISYLDFLSGDTTGAIALMKTAVAEGVESQLPSENLAWLYYELGEYFTQAGDPAQADAAYLTALTTHPGDYRALAGLAKLRANNGRYDEAIVLYQKAIDVVPMPIFVAELGDLYTRQGNAAEAKKQYDLVEYIGLLGHINQVLHNRDLALFYADHDIKLPEALELAQKEFEIRHDVYTWDALAWALYKNGRIEEAQKASQKALQFGTKDALLLYHSGMIAERMGHKDEARSDLKQALQINPHFHLLYAGAAQQSLTLLDAQAAAKVSAESHVR